MRNDVQKDTLEKIPCGTAASGSHLAADVLVEMERQRT